MAYIPNRLRGEIRLASLCDHENIIRDRRFEHVRLRGPGYLFIEGERTTFSSCNFLGPTEALFIVVEDHTLLLGVIRLINVQIIGCELAGLGIICTEDYKQMMLNQFAISAEWH